MIDTRDEERFSFAPFSRHPFFTQVNRWIVERVVCPGRQVIVDLGCGPGAVTKLILERLDDKKQARVIGIDPSASAIEKARAAISSRAAEFIQGSAEWLSRLVPSADAVVFLNAIHLVLDKARVVTEVRKALKPGGVFAFNTTFFAGAYAEGTGAFWRRWIVRSVQALKEQGIAVQHTGHAPAMQWLSPDEYRTLCEGAGLRPTTLELVQVDMTPESMRDISRFWLFIEGALPGVPLEQASEALQVGLTRALEETGVTAVPRNWLQVVAKAE
ncbi:MAG: class I SAM-dependent methyltransferase [Gemmatimonadales bacterium]